MATRGTLTFLFSDVEGSTQLLRRFPDRYPGLLVEIERLLRDACETRNGQLVDTQGDAHFFAFPTPRDALQAAVAAQRSFAAHHWPDDADVRVRIGLHTGAAATDAGRYYGLSVHRAARIAATAHGGQIVLSDTTAAVLRDDETPLEGISLTDLGVFGLKDFEHPVRLHAAAGEGLRADLPEPRAPSARGKRRRRRLIAVVAAAVVAALAVLIAIVTLGGGGGGGPIALEPGAVTLVDPGAKRATASVPLEFTLASLGQQAALNDGSLWLADQQGGSIVEIDGERHERGQTVGIGDTPQALTSREGEIWLWRTHGITAVVPPQSRPVLERSDTQSFAGAGTFSIEAAPGAVWAGVNDDLLRIDTDTDATTATIRLFDYVSAIAASSDRIWVYGVSNTFSALNPTTNDVEITINLQSPTPVDFGGVRTGTVLATDTDVVVASWGSQTVWRIDPATVVQTAVIATDHRPSIVWDGTALWLTTEDAPELWRLDPTTLETLEVILLDRPARLLAGDENGLWLYAVPEQ